MRYRPILAQHHPEEQQLSETRLRPQEESGEVGRSYGIWPCRINRPPRQRVGQQHVLYAWPSRQDRCAREG